MFEYEKRPFKRTLFRRVFAFMKNKKLLKAKTLLDRNRQ